jgi:hypothetical protein
MHSTKTFVYRTIFESRYRKDVKLTPSNNVADGESGPGVRWLDESDGGDEDIETERDGRKRTYAGDLPPVLEEPQETGVYVCMYVCMYVCILYIYIYIYIYVCVCVCVCVCVLDNEFTSVHKRVRMHADS